MLNEKVEDILYNLLIIIILRYMSLNKKVDNEWI